jgi:hypothetical protein
MAKLDARPRNPKDTRAVLIKVDQSKELTKVVFVCGKDATVSTEHGERHAAWKLQNEIESHTGGKTVSACMPCASAVGNGRIDVEVIRTERIV